MPGVSHKMLAQTLHSMEEDQIVEHLFEPPQSGTYSLTPFGTSLAQQVRDLCTWAKAHEEQLHALHARRRLRVLGS
ncbi:MAG: winged helix-turn-helix transcriptional regulator [Vulcanimicrobiaceae bacterium]